MFPINTNRVTAAYVAVKKKKDLIDVLVVIIVTEKTIYKSVLVERAYTETTGSFFQGII